MYLSITYILALSALLTLWRLVQLILSVRNRNRLARQHGCENPAPLPQKDKIFGIDVLLDEYRNFRNNTYLAMLVDRFNSCGDTWSCRTMGRTNFATINIENIKTILVTQSRFYKLGQTRSSVLGRTFGHGIFTSEGNEWRFLRRMTRPGFSASHVHLEPHVQSLLEQVPENGEACDLQPLFHNLTLHNAAGIFWGDNAVRRLDEGEGEGKGLATRINEAICKAFAHTQDIMVLGPLANLLQSSKTKSAIDLVYGFVLENSQAVFRQKSSPPATTGSHVPEKGESKAGSGVTGLFYDLFGAHDFDTIHTQLRQMFMAAEGTTAETLTHLFHLLSRHPRVLDTLRAEISLNLPPSDLPTSSDLTAKNTPYLNACIKEVLRLFPTVPFNNRIALQDTVLPRGGGADGLSPIVVPAGAEISLPHYPLYRRKDIFGDDADEFVPERWLQMKDQDQNEAAWTQQCESYLPFSIGKRACPGQPIALETVRYVAARLVQEFSQIRDASGNRPWRENCGATLQSKFGAVVAMERRMKSEGDLDSGYMSEISSGSL
ncbi:cytochrome P450 [Aspergillus karnatakaensis]|uniref:cytochrome P450 n=1 Tax=Aspergillus karnatakaensis TaxID=1810916 RepID=UPI003CCCDA67